MQAGCPHRMTTEGLDGPLQPQLPAEEATTVADDTDSRSDNGRFEVAPSQVSSDLGGEVVILDLDGGEYFGLDGVGARIWELLHEAHTLSELTSVIASEYDVDPERCRTDLGRLLADLTARGLVRARDDDP